MDKDYTFPEKNGKRVVSELLPTEITQTEFFAYLAVQKSGATNMFDIKMVGSLSGLPREKILRIMKNYSELSEKFTAVSK